jgi:hypothetical protein
MRKVQIIFPIIIPLSVELIIFPFIFRNIQNRNSKAFFFRIVINYCLNRTLNEDDNEKLKKHLLNISHNIN